MQSNSVSKKLDDLCKQVTQYRRAHFDKVKAEQNALPADQRKPHYLDKNGMPAPYSEEKIEESEFLFNIFSTTSDVAIQEVSIAEYLGKYKNFAPVSERFLEQGSDISRFAQSYMDEKELADFDFRKVSSSKSLSDFARDEQNIYDQYKSRAQDENSQSQFDKIREKLEMRKEKYEKMQGIHDEAAKNKSIKDTPTIEKYFDAESKG